MGCAKPEYCGAAPEPRRRARQTPLSCATLVRLMAASGEYRWLYRLPPLVGQLAVGGAVSRAAEKSPEVATSAATAADSVAAMAQRITMLFRRRDGDALCGHEFFKHGDRFGKPFALSLFDAGDADSFCEIERRSAVGVLGLQVGAAL